MPKSVTVVNAFAAVIVTPDLEATVNTINGNINGAESSTMLKPTAMIHA